MDFLSGITEPLKGILDFLKGAAEVLKWSLLVLAIGVGSYILRTACAPLIRILQWMFWHRPGETRNAVVVGIAHGSRLMLWGVLLGLGMWFIWEEDVMDFKVPEQVRSPVFIVSCAVTVLCGLFVVAAM